MRLDSEAKFNNLICSLAWALEIEQDGTKVDLLMSKATTLDLADELKDKYAAKLSTVYDEYVSRVENSLKALKQED